MLGTETDYKRARRQKEARRSGNICTGSGSSEGKSRIFGLAVECPVCGKILWN